MAQLGCQELSPRCEADEISPEGIDGYYIEWETELIAALLNQFPGTVRINEETVPMPEYRVNVSKQEIEQIGNDFYCPELVIMG